MSKTSKAWLAAAICASVIIIDQIIKIWVKTSFFWGEDVEITSWFHLKFIQNNGMAFGMEIGSKLFLTLFRIIVVSICIWLITRLVRKSGSSTSFIVCLSLIAAGALGNIIDCVFYGEIFNNPLPPEVATFVPWGHGYAPLLHGMVVDMFYFPLFSFTWPAWLPWIGGTEFSFFDPVFNFADAAINVGFFGIIIFDVILAGRRSKKAVTETGREGKAENNSR